MRLEAAKALNTAEVRPNGLAPSSKVFPFNSSLREVQRRGNLNHRNNSNIISLPAVTRTQLTVITPDHKPAQITEFPQPKPAEITLPQKTETSVIEETKKTESFHPRRSKKKLYDNMGRMIIRRRRASRCKTGGEHTKENCPTGSPARCRAINKRIKQNENVTASTSTYKVRNIDSAGSLRRGRINRDQLMKRAA